MVGYGSCAPRPHQYRPPCECKRCNATLLLDSPFVRNIKKYWVFYGKAFYFKIMEQNQNKNRTRSGMYSIKTSCKEMNKTLISTKPAPTNDKTVGIWCIMATWKNTGHYSSFSSLIIKDSLLKSFIFKKKTC